MSHSSSRCKLKLFNSFFLNKSRGFSWFTVAFETISPRSESSRWDGRDGELVQGHASEARLEPEFIPCKRHSDVCRVVVFKWEKKPHMWVTISKFIHDTDVSFVKSKFAPIYTLKTDARSCAERDLNRLHLNILMCKSQGCLSSQRHRQIHLHVLTFFPTLVSCSDDRWRVIQRAREAQMLDDWHAARCSAGSRSRPGTWLRGMQMVAWAGEQQEGCKHSFFFF